MRTADPRGRCSHRAAIRVRRSRGAFAIAAKAAARTRPRRYSAATRTQRLRWQIQCPPMIAQKPQDHARAAAWQRPTRVHRRHETRSCCSSAPPLLRRRRIAGGAPICEIAHALVCGKCCSHLRYADCVVAGCHIPPQPRMKPHTKLLYTCRGNNLLASWMNGIILLPHGHRDAGSAILRKASRWSSCCFAFFTDRFCTPWSTGLRGISRQRLT